MFPMPQQWTSRTIHVVLVGAGGSGSEMLDGLARIDRALRALGHPGLGIRVYDPDTVSAANTVRQRFWPTDVGQSKAALLVHRYATFGGLDARALVANATPASIADEQCDLLVTCVDKAATRAAIGAYDWTPGQRQALWLDLGNGAREGQVILGHLGRWDGDPQRLPNVYDLFAELHNPARLDADDTESCSADAALAAQDLFINRWVAVAAGDLLWQLLRRGQIAYHGLFINPSGARVRELPIDPQTWASFGLVPTTQAAAA